MQEKASVTSIVIAGIGGQGVITISDILAEAVFSSGFDVKKSEIHGMSQRGGSVTSDIRFGEKVYSPSVPVGGADFLLVVSPDQLSRNQRLLKPDGLALSADRIDSAQLPNARSINLAVLGMLAPHLPAIAATTWEQAIRSVMPEKLHQTALPAFELGRACQ